MLNSLVSVIHLHKTKGTSIRYQLQQHSTSILWQFPSFYQKMGREHLDITMMKTTREDGLHKCKSLSTHREASDSKEGARQQNNRKYKKRCTSSECRLVMKHNVLICNSII